MALPPGNSGPGNTGNPTSKKPATVNKKLSSNLPAPAGTGSGGGPVAPVPGSSSLTSKDISPTHSTILVLAIELLAVGVFTLLAGISNEWGRAVVIFMVALWIIYMVTTFPVLNNLGSALQNISNQA